MADLRCAGVGRVHDLGVFKDKRNKYTKKRLCTRYFNGTVTLIDEMDCMPYFNYICIHTVSFNTKVHSNLCQCEINADETVES